MKILIIANSNNIWPHSFIRHVLAPQDEIYLLSSDSYREEYMKTYKERDIVLLGKSRRIYRIPKLGPMLRRVDYCRAITKNNHFDVCIILNTTTYRLKIWNKIKENVDKTVVLYWGSDIHRTGRNELLNQQKYLDDVHNIVFSAENLKETFLEVHRNKREYRGKASVIHFGLESLEHIDAIRSSNSRDEVKKELKIPTDKIIVAIGYCGIPEQNHEKIIAEITKLNSKEKKDLCIMLQFMYNTETSYRQHIISLLDREGIDYVVFDKFLPPTELAKLRYATDIFVNAQTTDALAGSVIESIYAGAKLLNAEWLEYPEFMKWGLKYWRFKRFADLSKVLREVILSLQDIESIDVTEEISSDLNWQQCKEKWSEFLSKRTEA